MQSYTGKVMRANLENPAAKLVYRTSPLGTEVSINDLLLNRTNNGGQTTNTLVNGNATLLHPVPFSLDVQSARFIFPGWRRELHRLPSLPNLSPSSLCPLRPLR
jgi:hypothetical protein